MPINLELPKKFTALVAQSHQVAAEVFRPISRKYDEAEHAYPKELDMLASLIDGMNEGSDIGGAVTERSAVTSVLVAEALAQGDMGLATAILAPSAARGTSDLTPWST